MAVADTPNCGICKKPMKRVPNVTRVHGEAVWVCADGGTSKRPCDGDLYRIATLPRT